MHTNLAKEIYRKRIVIEGKYNVEISDLSFIYNLLLRLTKQVKDGEDIIKGMRGPFVYDYQFDKEVTSKSSFEGSIVWNEHEARLYTWSEHKFFTLDIYTCSPFDTDIILDFLGQEFNTKEIAWHEMPQPSPFNENSAIELRKSEKEGLGFCVYAKEFISQGTFLTYVDGEILYAEKESELSRIRKTTKDHAVAISKNFYRNTFNGLATKINHSCDPNAYIRDLFSVYTMRDIEKGEEITMSYSLFTNSDWKVPGGKCLCGAINCYGDIVPWRDLSKEDKQKFLPYTIDWILYEEMKARGYLENLKNEL